MKLPISKISKEEHKREKTTPRETSDTTTTSVDIVDPRPLPTTHLVIST